MWNRLRFATRMFFSCLRNYESSKKRERLERRKSRERRWPEVQDRLSESGYALVDRVIAGPRWDNDTIAQFIDVVETLDEELQFEVMKRACHASTHIVKLPSTQMWATRHATAFASFAIGR